MVHIAVVSALRVAVCSLAFSALVIAGRDTKSCYTDLGFATAINSVMIIVTTLSPVDPSNEMSISRKILDVSRFVFLVALLIYAWVEVGITSASNSGCQNLWYVSVLQNVATSISFIGVFISLLFIQA